ncbi:MAG: hypothetical protein H6Q20_2368, partial [Bacteroidetes bacterium]|nr:hypothetical protein [Bacteroidota bacterium]
MFKGLKVGFFRIVVLTISLHFGLFCEAQNVGDFRSFTSAAWKTASTWQVYNGTAWVSTSTYPGKNAGNYQVTILANHTVSINGQGISTLSMGGLTILGKLKLDGNTTGSTSNYSINSSYVEVVTGGSVELNNKANLKLPSNAVISVSEPGLAGNCNGSQHIYIGNVIYASCGITSATAFTFQQLMASGSSLKAVISSPSSVCVNDITQLTGGYVGLIDSDVTYSWSYAGPGMVSFSPDFSSQNPQIETSVPGIYTISLTVSTTRGGVTYTNTAQTYLNVIAKESYNYKTICASELPYWWDGFLFESEGVKVKQGLKNRLDCDSTATYALSLALPAVGSVVNKTICNGETVTFNGATYSTPGTYTAHLLSSTGCDSIVTLVLMACTVGSGEAYQIITSDVVTCPGVNTQLYASGVDYYKWSPATGLNDSTIANPIVNTQLSRVYTVSGYTESKTNLIHNGDFELGNTGFTSDYEYNPATLYGEGDYAVINNPNSLHGNFSACGDHTSGTGKMMVINGNTVAKSKVWGQTIQVDPNKEYAFYAYVTPVNASNPPVLQFSINGQILGEPYQSPSTTCQWNKFYAIWKSGTAQVAEISIVNQNIVANGNDFALDDIKYVELYKSSALVHVNVGANSSTTQTSVCKKDLPYLWNGKLFTNSGIYKDTLINAVGCDSIATLELTVKEESYSTTKVDICSKDAPYIWHGKSYSSTGIYKDTLTNTVGCDSIATLDLTVKAESYSTTKVDICSKEAPYIWNGKSYSLTGIYKDTLTNAAGCDSIATLELTVKTESYSTTKVDICSKEAPYLWHGKSYSLSGIYKDTLTNAAGCDSIATLELTVKAESYSTTKVDICSKDAPYLWNGKSYLSTGIYKDTLINAVGCDSIATLELTVKAESYSTSTIAICSKEAPYIWNGKSYSFTGIYKDTLINAVGCDSIATLELTVKAESYSTTAIAICSKEAPYIWNGKFYSSTGIYKDTLVNAAGCDSIATLELTVKAESFSTTTIAICSKEAPYIWHGKSYLSTGIYKDTLINAAGCDSIATLELTVKTESYSTTKVDICSKEAPYLWNGKSYSSTGIYKDTLVNVAGCDSIATLELTVKAESYSITKVDICSK